MAVAPRAVRLIENTADVAALDDLEGPVAFLTQTTLSLADWQEMLDATQARFPGVWVPERRDVCFATTNRQSAVRLYLFKGADYARYDWTADHGDTGYPQSIVFNWL